MVGRRRRRNPSPEVQGRIEALSGVVDAVGRAKDGLAAARPSRRGEGVPLAEALSAFEVGLAEADAGMAAWRWPDLERTWIQCRAGLIESRRRAERLRLSGTPPSGYEQLYGVLGDLMDPLDAFEDALEEVRRLGR